MHELGIGQSSKPPQSQAETPSMTAAAAAAACCDFFLTTLERASDWKKVPAVATKNDTLAEVDHLPSHYIDTALTPSDVDSFLTYCHVWQQK
jgi:hypothetical protein